VALLAVLPAEALAQGRAMCKTALDGPMDPTTEAFNELAVPDGGALHRRRHGWGLDAPERRQATATPTRTRIRMTSSADKETDRDASRDR
jgi:hypothetical protein